MADRRPDPGDPAALAVLPLSEPGARATALRRVARDGAGAPVDRPLAEEVPVAIEVDGLGYAVMLATPTALHDFVAGFCLSERIADRLADIEEIDVALVGRGAVARVALVPARRGAYAARVRHRATDSACGLCGIENFEQALPPLPRVSPAPAPPHAAVFAALDALRDHQPLGRATGAAHAAALCGIDGSIRLVREDVGRHNAFDKLIGAMARTGLRWDGGFALLSSRLSCELVEKAARADCPTLAAISAPTALALDRAAEAGVRLIALARPDSFLTAP